MGNEVKQILQRFREDHDENFLVPGNAIRMNTIDFYLLKKGLPNNYDPYCQMHSRLLTPEDVKLLEELDRLRR